MITCSVSVAENAWKTWLDAVGNLSTVHAVELPASMLVDAPAACALVEHYGLTVAHVRDLLPAEVARYLAETPARGRRDVPDFLRDMLLRCEACAASLVSLEMGLDRIDGKRVESELEARVALLRGLMPVAEMHRLTLCVQVRYPRAYPGSKEWEYAGNLVHDLAHPCCRLALNVVPADLPADFDIGAFVRSNGGNAGVLRFHYDPALGENLNGAAQQTWAAALQRIGFKGTVVFCPRLADDTTIPDACRRIDAWAAAYGAAPGAGGE